MIKLTIEGTVDDVEDFLLDIAGVDGSPAPDSVPKPARLEDLRKDRIYRKLEEKLREKKIVEKAKPVVSVPKAPSARSRDHDRKIELPTKDDLLISPFEYEKKLEKFHKPLFICELPDGRVALRYMSGKVFTTREKILSIPYPVPAGYLKNIGLAANPLTAIRHYRAYLAAGNSVHPGNEIQNKVPDRKEEKDLDAPFKPKLSGAFSTHPGKEDFDKIEGSLEK